MAFDSFGWGPLAAFMWTGYSWTFGWGKQETYVWSNEFFHYLDIGGDTSKVASRLVTHDFTHRLPVATLLTILCQWGRKTKEVIIDYC